MKKLKVALYVLGGVVGTLLLGIGVFYVGWLHPPSPEDVCANVVKLMTQEAGRAPPSTFEAECRQNAATPPRFGRIHWVRELKCMRDASSVKALKDCGRRDAGEE